ncbi:AMP deaminase [Rhizoctonia solani]|uniref:AMP deaminase n=1 Tax=Rhizoctonia solani TaxID=456999 RepID=A0A8H8NX83_9AGAM|nr:AMP deaminase [Rhizoctonia solani]QRW20422.1 AMP deaminase [Rhizoctonia solani]
MGGIRTSRPVAASDNATSPPGALDPVAADPHPALKWAYIITSPFRSHIGVALQYLIPMPVPPDVPTPNPRRRRRGATAAVVAAPVQHVIMPVAVTTIPDQCQRRLTILLCSPPAIVWVSTLIGSIILAPPVVPVDPTHVSANAAIGDPEFCVVHAGLKLVEVVCNASYELPGSGL